MTIVATEDSRNGEWKNGNKGASLLKKMGWTEGQGLGRDKQGTSVALRAVKRSEETLGIGASSADIHGSSGWNETSDGFASVLRNLKHQHDDGSSDKKKKSKKKKNNLTLARNKVTAGHAQKMREAKCLKNKSDEEMAAIFGNKHVPSTNESEKKKKKKKKRKSRDDNDEKKRSKKSKKEESTR
jgi:Pin2-interacting protein X1